MRAAMIAAGAVLTLTACSSTGGATPSTAAPSVSATRTTAPVGPTARQFASVVARDEVAVREAARSLAPCRGQYGALLDRGLIICTIGWDTESLSVDTLAVDLRGVGRPPAEVRSLVADTLGAASFLHRAQRRLAASCSPNRASSTACESASFVWYTAAARVAGELGAWRPYGG